MGDRIDSQSSMRSIYSTNSRSGQEFQFIKKRTLLILYFTYGSFYLSRKADSAVKSSLHELDHFTVEELAYSDTMYLLIYTIAIGFSGVFGSYVASNRLLGISLVGIALTSFFKSFMTTPNGFAYCQIIHAIFQSTGWPTCIKLIGIYVTENRGLVMGLWTTCQSLGGVIGAILAAKFITTFDWRYAYYYQIPIQIFMAFINLKYICDDIDSEYLPLTSKEGETKNNRSNSSDITISLNSNPATETVTANDIIEKKEELIVDKKLEKYLLSPKSSEIEDNNFEESEKSNKSTLHRVLLIPGVIPICVAYFFLKFMRYALLMWLPYYYEEGLGFQQVTATYISSTFELGGFFGTPLIGYISDRVMHGKRDLTAGYFLSGASFMLFMCVVVSTWGKFINGVCMFLVGVLIIGPDSILSGTIAQDLGGSSGIGSQSIGTLAGFINMTGSFGSIFQSYATAIISRIFGWNMLFMCFVVCSLASSSILFNVAFKSYPHGKKLGFMAFITKSPILKIICAIGFISMVLLYKKMTISVSE